MQNIAIMPIVETPVWSISDLSLRIKQVLEHDFSFVKVRGEVSGFKKHSSGHLYFSLKDESSVIDCVSWRGSIKQGNFILEDGLEIIATGRITTYGGRSKYQMVITGFEHTGQGALLKVLEDRKAKLMAEGLFDPSRKKPLPQFPLVIGVVTSPTGAVIKDILHRINERWPCHVIVWPVLVQGNGAAEQITKAIEGFNNFPKHLPQPDLIIVARGGGSLEDLWCFNEETVVRAAANSRIPLISAVGHETDTTLIDFASDQRAPTPTAAAEIATPARRNLFNQVEWAYKRLEKDVLQKLRNYELHFSSFSRSLQNPQQIIEEKMMRCDELYERMNRAIDYGAASQTQHLEHLSRRIKSPMEKISRSYQTLAHMEYLLNVLGKASLNKSADKLEFITSRLETISYENTLKRGFCLVRNSESGAVITRADQTEITQQFELSFYDDSIQAVRIDEKLKASKPKPRIHAASSMESKKIKQDTLF